MYGQKCHEHEQNMLTRIVMLYHEQKIKIPIACQVKLQYESSRDINFSFIYIHKSVQVQSYVNIKKI